MAPPAGGDGWIGRPLRRREDARLLRGEGRYAADLPPPPGTLHAAFARAPASGRLVGVEAPAGALTAAGLGPHGQPAVNSFFPGMPPARFAPLAGERVAMGQPVALLLADTPQAALDAAESVVAEIAEEPGTEAPAWEAAWGGEAGTAFAGAAHVVRARIAHARLAPTALEPRAALAVPEGDGMTVWLSSQTPHRARKDLAAVLGIDPARLRVVAPDVGGTFGAKASIAPEEAAVAWAAWRTGRPVRWVASRSEEMLSATQGRGGVLEGELALDAAGRALALRARVAVPLGQRLTYSAAVPGRNAARILPGPYAVPAVSVGLEARFGPEAAVGIYRGAGRPEAAMLLERLMDLAAHATGRDPAAIRAANLVTALPHALVSGEVLDSGDYPALLRAMGDWPALAAARDARRAAGEVVGLGLALYVEPCGAGWESARLTLAADGTVTAALGTTIQGQGRETATAQIVAEALRLDDPARVRVVHGDTDATPEGIGALASRSTGIGGGALLQAAAALEEQARPLAARLLQGEPAPAPGGWARADDPGRVLPWSALAPLTAEAVFHAQGESWASGCCLARVAVDGDTGGVTVEHLRWADDIGRIVNPMLVRGQQWGGLAQGLGEALLERVVYDEAGQLLTGTLMDYALPRAEDMPLAVEFPHAAPHAARNTPLGAKGVGEAGCIGVPAAIVNAVADALSPFGVRFDSLALPLTPERVWRAMRGEEPIARGSPPPPETITFGDTVHGCES